MNLTKFTIQLILAAKLLCGIEVGILQSLCSVKPVPREQVSASQKPVTNTVKNRSGSGAWPAHAPTFGTHLGTITGRRTTVIN